MLPPALAAMLALVPAAAMAQDGPRLAFTLRGGVEARPGYFGSDELSVGPDLRFSLGYVSLGSLSFGDPELGPDPLGLGVRGSFRLISARSSDENEELEGLEDVDTSVEIGAGLAYTQPNWEAFADLRYGVIGHGSLVADLGVDAIIRPTNRLTLRAGPRLFLGSSGFASTYFGVTEAESEASLRAVPHDDGPAEDLIAGHIVLEPAFEPFEAEGGILSAGLEVAVEYRLSDLWGLEGGVRYDRLRGDAAASPITAEDDQLSAYLGVTRRFDIRF